MNARYIHGTHVPTDGAGAKVNKGYKTGIALANDIRKGIKMKDAKTIKIVGHSMGRHSLLD